MNPKTGPHDRRSTRPTFRPDIEGLRAVAVAAVVLYHAEIPGIRGGFVGVDVFFVISGFLITGLLWREANNTGTVNLRAFFGARARRLLPASALVGIITMIASTLLLPPLQVPIVLYDGIFSALYVGNYWFILDHINYFSDLLTPSPFQHYWSLGVEEQFYFVWPALIIATAWLIRLTRRRGKAEATAVPGPYVTVLAITTALSFASSLVLTYMVPTLAFFSLPTRAWELALGGLIALTSGRWQQLSVRSAVVTGCAGIAMIMAACTFFTSTTPFPGVAALLPVIGAMLIIGAGCAAPTLGCGRLLTLAPMQAVGRFSYSLYLWHWPVLVLAPVLLGRALNLPTRIAAVVLSCALAWLTLRYIENPLRFAPRIRESAWRSLGLGTVATATAVAVGVTLLPLVPPSIGHGPPVAPLVVTAASVSPGSDLAAYNTAVQRTFTQVQAALTRSVGLTAVPTNLNPSLGAVADDKDGVPLNGCLRGDYETGQPECAMGDTNSRTRVALIGDSHAAMWTPAFLQVANERHWRLEMMAKEACPIIDIHVDSGFRRLVERMQHCQDWRGQIMTRLKANPPQLVVVSVWRGYGVDESLTGFRGFNEAWLDSLTQLVQQIRATGARVLVLGPVPAPHQSVPVCLSGHLNNATACQSPRSTAVDQSGILAETSATEAAGGQYADLTDLFCTTGRCLVIVGNTLVYFDVSHLTAAYSKVLAPAMGALADRALAHT